MKKASDVFKKIRFAKMDPNHEKAGPFSTDDEEHYTVSTKEWEQQVKHVKKRSMQEVKEVGDEQIGQETPNGLVKKGNKTVMVKPLNQEAKEKTEYDYEGDMARGQLQSIINNAQRVHDMLKDNDNLPEWVQSKITLSEDYISTVANYMMSEIDEEVVTEAKNQKPSSLDRFRKASNEREKKHDDAEKEMKARHAAGKKDMKGSIDRLEKHLNKEEVQKADIPAYLRKQRGDKPLTVADVKAPRKDSISAAATLQKMKNEETKPPFDGPYTTVKNNKNNGAQTARNIARAAMKKQAEKMPVKKSIKESRKSEIVKDIIKKKDPKDKFQANPTLTSQVQKIDNAVT
jgi:hypothetical protein